MSSPKRKRAVKKGKNLKNLFLQRVLQSLDRTLDRSRLKHPRRLAGLGLAGLAAFFLVVKYCAREGDASSFRGELTYKVTRGDLLISFIERGNIRAAKSIQVYNQFEGVNTIVSLVPEGTYVKAGDLLVELDSSDTTQLLNQLQIQVDTAE